ncbi:MAG: hypothetical protein K2X38_02020 [Gemmataceae bacterium]|nr:hypothetical protein [Gemmataceae bacterium]
MRLFLLLLALPTLVHAQPCGPGGCPVPIIPAAKAEYRWVQSPEDPQRIYLYQGAAQLGGYDLDRHYYRPLLGEGWGEACEPPISPPCFGVSADRLAEKPRYSLNGRTVDPNRAYEAVSKGLTDDSGKLRVTIIGSDEKRRQVRSDLEAEPTFAAERERFAVRDYPPDHWSLRPGFVVTADPTIYCQSPDGKVLHRQDDYIGGAATLLAALRQTRNDYDPKKDPDLRTSRNLDPQKLAPFALLAVAAFVFLRRSPTLSRGF